MAIKHLIDESAVSKVSIGVKVPIATICFLICLFLLLIGMREVPISLVDIDDTLNITAPPKIVHTLISITDIPFSRLQ